MRIIALILFGVLTCGRCGLGQAATSNRGEIRTNAIPQTDAVKLVSRITNGTPHKDVIQYLATNNVHAGLMGASGTTMGETYFLKDGCLLDLHYSRDLRDNSVLSTNSYRPVYTIVSASIRSNDVTIADIKLINAP